MAIAVSMMLSAAPAMAADAAPPAASSTAPPAATRQVQTESHRNLRSLDAVPVTGGAIRHGVVYRSARLSHIAGTDKAAVKNLHLRTIVDFRSNLEKMFEGADAGDIRHGCNYVSLPLATGMLSSDGYRVVLNSDKDKKSIKRFFDLFADQKNYPILYHCALGKDRTGVMTALLLMSMGTSRDVIMDDYLLSGSGAHREWLNQVFDEVDKAGGIQPLLSRYGIDAAEIAAIRTNLVENTLTQQSTPSNGLTDHVAPASSGAATVPTVELAQPVKSAPPRQ
jgi:protein-tyrosine phosphatase